MEPKIYGGLRSFRRTLDQTIAVLDYILDNECLYVSHYEIKEAVELWAAINEAVGNHLASDELIGEKPMDIKAQIYSDMSTLNSGFAAILTSLKALQEKGVISADYLQQQTEMTEELRAGINTTVMNKRQESEAEDWHDFGKMRETTERRLRGEQTVEGLPPET